MRAIKRILPLVLVLCMLLTIAPAAFALTLEPSGYELEVSDYAPQQSTETGAIGGNYNLFTFDDFVDLTGGQYEAYRDAVNWWLNCGVTNGGETWNMFGVMSPFHRWELAFFLYRFYNITNDDGLWLYDDFSHNPLSGDTLWKFTDSVYACRWSGVLGAYEGNNFNPQGIVDANTILDSLFKVLTWSPEILDEETRAMIEEFTGKPYTETSTYVCAVFPEELVAAAQEAQDPTGFFMAEGLVPEDIDLLAPLSKLDAIQLLYGICKGTGTRTADKFATQGSATVVNDFSVNTEISGETFELIGEPDNEIAGTTLIAAHDGAQVTISDSTITSDNVVEGSGYQLAYRWGEAMSVISYGEGTVLTFKNCDFNWLDTVERQQGGFFPTCGGTIIVDNCNVSRQSSGCCYNGTLIYKDCDNLTTAGTQTGRSHSSDFFSGITIFDNCVMNKDGVGPDDATPTAFNDEAATLFIVNCPYYGDGFGTMTGVATAYVENSVLDATPTGFTNNTSQYTDVTSYTVYNSEVTYSQGIATVQKEAKVDARYIDCGVINLGEGMTASSSEPGDVKYDITIEGAEFGIYSSMRIRLDNTTFSRPLKVFVAPGCELIIEVQPGTELPEVIQNTSESRTIRSYVEKVAFPEASYNVFNQGTVVVREVDWNS